MRVQPFILVAALLVGLTGCPLRRNPKAAKTPPAPKPAAATAATLPPPPPKPVSTAQTEVELPLPQPVSPEALASIPDPAPPPAEPVQAPRPPRRTSAAPPKPEPAPPATVETPVVTPAPPDDTPRLQAVVPEEERRRILADLERRRVEIDNVLRRFNRRRLSSYQKGLVDNIHSFMTAADDSAKRGDMRTADLLSERALILARELANAR